MPAITCLFVQRFCNTRPAQRSARQSRLPGVALTLDFDRPDCGNGSLSPGGLGVGGSSAVDCVDAVQCEQTRVPQAVHHDPVPPQYHHHVELDTYPLFRRDDIRPILPTSARRVLDVGCGPGGLGLVLRDLYPTAYLVGVEPEPTHAVQARDIFDEVHEGYFPDDLPAGLTPFDLVTLSDVVEHVSDPWAMLRAVVPLLAPGGVVAAAIPNVRHFSISLPLVLRGRWTYTYEGITARTHLRFFARETVEELFASTGYAVERIEMLNGPWDGNPRWRRWKRPTRPAHDLLCQHYGVVSRPR